MLCFFAGRRNFPFIGIGVLSCVNVVVNEDLFQQRQMNRKCFQRFLSLKCGDVSVLFTLGKLGV